MASCRLCGASALANWTRRPTAAELAATVALVQQQQSAMLALADPTLPPPVFPALPTATNTTTTVFACAAHAVSLALASQVHQSTCTAPNAATLPGCDCTPEAIVTTLDVVPVVPDGWSS